MIRTSEEGKGFSQKEKQWAHSQERKSQERLWRRCGISVGPSPTEHLRSRGWVALLGDDGRGEEWKAFPRYIRHVLKKTGECSQCRKQFNKEPSKGVEAYISLLKKYSSMFSLYIVG